MKLLTTFTLLLGLATTGCKSNSDKASTQGSATPSPTSPTTPAPADPPPPAPTPAAAADSIVVLAEHAEKKPNDPVKVEFTKFSVTKVAFTDPKALDGATATIAIDLSSLSSGSAKRDGHLKGPAYIDLEKFATITVDVANVKATDDTKAHYAADAKVSFHGVDKTYPVKFDVVRTTQDSVTIAATHTFPRLDFNLGKAPSPDESVAENLQIRIRLTLTKS